MDTELIFYNRIAGCPYSTVAKMLLERKNIPFHEIFIDMDRRAGQRVEKWTGYRVVPTLVIAEKGKVTPVEVPESLPEGKSPRGIDRGYMISEPTERQLKKFLTRHNLLAKKGLFGKKS